MELRKTPYYDAFRCLAGACPDSCCHLWEVQVDDDSVSAYRALPGALGDTLRNALYEADGETYLALTETGRCPMWREDGLCRLQAALGEAYLCHTCREFPRLRHDYGSFVELGLELSCPEAARLILEDPDGALLSSDVPGGEAPDYEEAAMAVLEASRKVALTLLDGTYPPERALALLLLYGAQAQAALDGGALADFSPEQALETAAQFALPGDMEEILDFFRKLEILTPSWQRLLDCPAPAPWENGHLSLARYFVCRYWLQAVSDYDLYGRVKFAVIACLVTRHLGGALSRTAQLFSKEIENDGSNVDAILDGAYRFSGFADAKLLGLLLNFS